MAFDGVYSGSVYGKIDMNDIQDPLGTSMGDVVSENEQAVQTSPVGLYNQIKEMTDKIDGNIAFLYDYVQSLKNVDPDKYNELKNDYNITFEQYNDSAATAYQAQSDGNLETANIALQNLQLILDYTNEMVNNINMESGMGPAQSSTAMVVHNEDVVEMENVGIVRSWWTGMQPGTRTMIKAIAVAGAIFGIKAGWERFVKK